MESRVARQHHPLLAWHVTHWGDDPYSRGSWSVPLAGGSTADRRALGQPIDDRLMFAGEATNSEQPAMTHGAWESGLAAASWAIAGRSEKVVVIGAGCAGLAAATTLRDAGIEVVVLEARSRAGGRAHTTDVGGVDVDVGAAWLQQLHRNPLAALAGELGVEMVRTDFASPLAAAYDGAVPDVSAAFARLRREIDRSIPFGDAIKSYLGRLTPAERRAAEFAIEADLILETGMTADRLSPDALDEPGVGAGDHLLRGGYRVLIDQLSRDLEIMFDTPVTCVRWDDNGVVVDHVGAHEVRADRCICTIPIGVIPSLSFEPGLPTSHLRALAHLGMGVVEKVVLRYTERWWPVAASGYLRWYELPASWGDWADLTDVVGAPTVAGFIGGDAVARHHHGHTDEQIARAAAGVFERWAAVAAEPRAS
jgi:monoamine oxidase